MVKLRQALIGHFAVSAPETDTNLLLTVAGQGDDLRVVMEGVSGGKRYSIEKLIRFDTAAWAKLAADLEGKSSFELPIRATVGTHKVSRKVRYRVTPSLAAPGSLVFETDTSLRVTAIKYECNPFWLVAMIVAAVTVVAVSTVAVTAMLTCSDVDMSVPGASSTVKCGRKFTEASEPIPFYPDEGPGGEHGI